MEIYYHDPVGERVFVRVGAFEIHPGYVPDAIKLRVQSIDLALVKAERPLDSWLRPALLSRGYYPSLGVRVTISGFGGTAENDWSSSGTLRSAALHVRAPLSRVLIWASEPGMDAGACSGDAGAPVFAPDGELVVAIATWAQAQNGRGCGGLTQGPIVAPVIDWIDAVLGSWGEHLPDMTRSRPPVMAQQTEAEKAFAADTKLQGILSALAISDHNTVKNREDICNAAVTLVNDLARREATLEFIGKWCNVSRLAHMHDCVAQITKAAQSTQPFETRFSAFQWYSSNCQDIDS
jgi:hypothetical protein